MRLPRAVGEGFVPPPLGSRWGEGEAGGHPCSQQALMKHLPCAGTVWSGGTAASKTGKGPCPSDVHLPGQGRQMFPVKSSIVTI